MTIPPPDGSRDRRIEDLSNLYVIHPVSRALVPVAVTRGISANTVSVVGLGFGILAMTAFVGLPGWRGALLGLGLACCWLIADGLDGMVARATGTASRLGRILDGLCDHGVFILIYCALAWSIGTVGGWALAIAAGVAHAVQSSLYEGERARFHRRLRLQPAPSLATHVPVYDRVATAFDRAGSRLDARIVGPSGASVAAAYVARAVAPMRLMALLSANVRVGLFGLAVFVREPALAWWIELVPLTVVAAVTMTWHRQVERQVTRGFDPAATPAAAAAGAHAGYGRRA